MHEHEQLITKFYTAFKNSDAKAMGECYHRDVVFSDPVFPILRGDDARAMWAFLCVRKTDPASRWFENVRASQSEGSAHWEAKYAFPLNGRPVHNKIDASFHFQDGKIVAHTDLFDFWAWSRMAFGPVGLIFGWTPLFKAAIRKQIRARFDQFRANSPGNLSA